MGYASLRLAHGVRDHIDYAREAVRLADESDDLAVRRVVRWALTRSLVFAGHWCEGLTCAEEAMEQLARDPTLGTAILGFNPIRCSPTYARIFSYL
jgi:hypothetical protein